MNGLINDMTKLREETNVLGKTRKNFLAELKQGTVEMQEDFRKARSKRAKKTRNELMTFVSDMKGDVFQMQEGFRNARGEMSRKTRDELMTFVSDLKGDVFQMQEGFRNAHNEMAGKTKADREAFVSSLKQVVADKLREFSNDLEAARRVWFGLAPEEAKPKTREVKETRAEAEPEVIEEETLQEVIPDDLTEIKGIGSGMQKQLYDGGITTYAQLAECTPDDLRRVLGEKFARLAPNAENWIEQAKELVN